MSNTLYVKNLSLQTTEDDLYKLFSLMGKVVRIYLIKDAQSGHFVGAGYVTMATTAAARSARIDLDGTRLIDRNIVVTEARQRTAPAQTSDPGSGRPGSRSGGSGSRRG